MRREYILKGDMKVVRRHCGRCDYVWDVPEATRVAAVTASGRIRRIRHLGNKPEQSEPSERATHPRRSLSFRPQSADISRMWFLVVGIAVAAGTIYLILRRRRRAARRHYIEVGAVSEGWIAQHRGGRQE